RTTGEERNQIAVASLDDPKPKVLMKADSLVGFDRGNLLYVRENTLFAQRLDERTLELKGEPVEIATNVAFSESWGTSGASVSPAGVIAYYPVYLPRVEVRVYDRKGAALRTVLTDDFIGEPQFSPDGRRIAFSRFDQKKGASDIWIVDVARGIRSRVTGGLADHVSPAWSPDGERIAWLSDRDGMYDVLTQQVDSNARPVNIWRGGRDKVSVQWMPDGRSILATVEFPNTLRDIYIGSTTGEKPKPVVTDQSDDEDASASPDGHWIAFASRHAGGPYEVYVIPTSGGRIVQLSTAGGTKPAWSHDGTEVFYVAADRTLMAVPIHIRATSIDASAPKPLFVLPRTGPDLPFTTTPDGNFLVAVRTETDSTDHVDVVLNWRGKLAAHR
ncbi:MAG: TolB family protein, partial [Thermoanaerobaculia bacterium]